MAVDFAAMQLQLDAILASLEAIETRQRRIEEGVNYNSRRLYEMSRKDGGGDVNTEEQTKKKKKKDKKKNDDEAHGRKDKEDDEEEEERSKDKKKEKARAKAHEDVLNTAFWAR